MPLMFPARSNDSILDKKIYPVVVTKALSGKTLKINKIEEYHEPALFDE
jgi:hypothetical protein